MTSRLLAPAAVLALVVGGVAATVSPAQAAGTGVVGASVSLDSKTSSCSAVSDAPVSNKPIAGNGATVTSQSATGPVETHSTTDASDTATLWGSAKGSFAVREAGTLTSITATLTGSARASIAKGDASVCDPSVDAETALQYEFTTAGGWLTVSAASNHNGLVQVGVMEASGFDVGGYTIGAGLKTSTSTRYFLPAGTYVALVAGAATADATTPVATLSASATFTFAPAGSAAGPVAGAAGRFASLPAARDCAHHRATVVVKGVGRKARPKKVQVLANGHVVATVRSPKASRTITVSLPDSAAATLSVKVTPKKGKKHPTLTRGYLACS